LGLLIVKTSRAKVASLSIVLSVAALAYFSRDGIACASSGDDRLFGTDHSEIIKTSRLRVSTFYGSTDAHPKLFAVATAWDRFVFGNVSHAKTIFTPLQTCILVGPQGRNVDVVAHELVHAEVANRIGFLNRFLHFPVWLDEGLAMQVDHRTQYDMVNFDKLSPPTLEDLTSTQGFYSGDNQTLTFHYAYSKAQVRKWLDRLGGPPALYPALAEIRNGHSVAALLMK
jgi:hypothetical protein